MSSSDAEAARLGVSVVLPCYNRGAYLAHWLEACAWWQPFDFPLEILVVDDGGADHTEAIVDRWCERGLDVRYLRLRGAGGPRNNAQARNAGIRAARYPLVLNSDPDVVFVTDVLRRLAERWRPGAFCSLTSYYPLTRDASRDLWRISEERPLTPEDYLARAVGRHNLVCRPDGVYGLHGAVLCDRATLSSMRGYDERFHVWGWEDRDLLTRLERGLGFERRYVSDATVVHQWHPALRADYDPQDDVSRSRVLWQMGWQQACATTQTSVDRNQRGWGEWHAGAPGLEEAGAARSAIERVEWDLHLDAYRHEAQVWRRDGQPRLAMTRLRLALSRWWEHGDHEPRQVDDIVLDTATLADAISRAHAAGYARPRDLVLELAFAASEAGERFVAEAALAAAERSQGSGIAIAHLRVHWLVDAGRLGDAARLLEDVLGCTEPADAPPDEGKADCVARLVEILLRLDRAERAQYWIDRMLATHRGESGQPTPAAGHDAFERLLFEGYRACLRGRSSDVQWLPRVGADHAGEFLFSVAMRARRAGLTVGALAMFEAYLASGVVGEDELRVRAARLRDEAVAEWTRLTAAAPCSAGDAR